MSYRTNWKLDATLENGIAITEQKKKEINKYIFGNSDMDWVFCGGLGEWGEDDRSFTDSDKNMKRLSEKYPDTLFILKYDMIGDCEDGLNTEYWLNGKVQREELQYVTPPFDSSKLEEV